MARIQLRDTTIYIQDGLSGTALSNETTLTPLQSPAETTTQEGGGGLDETQTIEQFANTVVAGNYTLTIDLAGESAFTTANIEFDATAAEVETAIDTAATAAGVTGWTNGDISVSGGPLNTADLTLTFDGTSVTDTNHAQSTIQDVDLTVQNTADNLDVDSVGLNSDVTDQVPVGARFTVADEVDTPIHTVTARTPSSGTTTNITFTPALTGGGGNDETLTFLPQRITIKIGDGDLSWTESRELIYDRDRDLLDTVRLGEEQPVSVDLNFTFEFVTTESGKNVTPVDALKRVGEATEWVSSSSDLCEPYAVDIYVIHDLTCGTDQDQDFLFPDFRYESLDYSIQDATIAVSGTCNVADVTTTRADSFS